METLTISTSEDYLTSISVTANGEEKINLPKSNVLKYTFTDGSWVCLRPSGTEPKVKFYFGVNSDSLEESKRKLEEIEKDFMDLVNDKINKLSRSVRNFPNIVRHHERM